MHYLLLRNWLHSQEQAGSHSAAFLEQVRTTCPGDGAISGELSPPTLVTNEDNSSQRHQWANLIWTLPLFSDDSRQVDSERSPGQAVRLSVQLCPKDSKCSENETLILTGTCVPEEIPGGGFAHINLALPQHLGSSPIFTQSS